MGRLAISRGFPTGEPPGGPRPVTLVEIAAACAEPAPVSLAAVQLRIDALERLARLCEAGALTIDEFLIEKAAILGHPRSALMGIEGEARGEPISFEPVKSAKARRGRSLAHRLGWFVLPLGLICGLGLSAISQPQATQRLFEEGLRLFGL